MKRLTLLLVLLIQIFTSCGQNKVTETEDQSDRYKIYQTENIYCLLELDTYTGTIHQIHYTTDENGFEGKVLLDSLPSFIRDDIYRELPFNVKHLDFELYPTKNMYTFILVEQYSGNVWHVQWNNDKGYRFISKIYDRLR